MENCFDLNFSNAKLKSWKLSLVKLATLMSLIAEPWNTCSGTACPKTIDW